MNQLFNSHTTQVQSSLTQAVLSDQCQHFYHSDRGHEGGPFPCVLRRREGHTQGRRHHQWRRAFREKGAGRREKHTPTTAMNATAPFRGDTITPSGLYLPFQFDMETIPVCLTNRPSPDKLPLPA